MLQEGVASARKWNKLVPPILPCHATTSCPDILENATTHFNRSSPSSCVHVLHDCMKSYGQLPLITQYRGSSPPSHWSTFMRWSTNTDPSDSTSPHVHSWLSKQVSPRKTNESTFMPKTTLQTTNTTNILKESSLRVLQTSHTADAMSKGLAVRIHGLDSPHEATGDHPAVDTPLGPPVAAGPERRRQVVVLSLN